MKDKILVWVLARLKERSTWVGIVGLLTTIGINLSPELQNAIITIGVSIISAVFTFTADQKPVVTLVKQENETFK